MNEKNESKELMDLKYPSINSEEPKKVEFENVVSPKPSQNTSKTSKTSTEVYIEKNHTSVDINVKRTQKFDSKTPLLTRSQIYVEERNKRLKRRGKRMFFTCLIVFTIIFSVVGILSVIAIFVNTIIFSTLLYKCASMKMLNTSNTSIKLSLYKDGIDIIDVRNFGMFEVYPTLKTQDERIEIIYKTMYGMKNYIINYDASSRTLFIENDEINFYTESLGIICAPLSIRIYLHDTLVKIRASTHLGNEYLYKIENVTVKSLQINGIDYCKNAKILNVKVLESSEIFQKYSDVTIMNFELKNNMELSLNGNHDKWYLKKIKGSGLTIESKHGDVIMDVLTIYGRLDILSKYSTYEIYRSQIEGIKVFSETSNIFFQNIGRMDFEDDSYFDFDIRETSIILDNFDVRSIKSLSTFKFSELFFTFYRQNLGDLKYSFDINMEFGMIELGDELKIIHLSIDKPKRKTGFIDGNIETGNKMDLTGHDSKVSLIFKS